VRARSCETKQVRATNSEIRLKEERKRWQALSKPQTVAPLLRDPSHVSTSLPDASQLDLEEQEMLRFLENESTSSTSLRSHMQSQLSRIHSSLEFKIDQLADGVHRLSERVSVAGNEAGKVLAVSAARLKSREDRERSSAGTKDISVMEVLRSLGQILPESGG
jgi:kinetochore protein Mis13/DSN1